MDTRQNNWHRWVILMWLFWFWVFFFPLCCCSLTEFFKALLKHFLLAILLSTCKSEGNSCHVLYMAIIPVVCEKNPQDPSQKNKRDNDPLMRCFLSRRVKLEKNVPVDGGCSHSVPQPSSSSLRSWSIREMGANNILASLKSTNHWNKLQY